MTLRTHSNKVYMISLQLGEKIGLTEEKLKELSISALLHDIGKTRIPGEILNKKGRLTKDEMNIMKQHVKIGADIARKMGYNDSIVTSILHHHEKYDGKGYLSGIKEKEIPINSRIIAIADSFDAMMSNRCYRKAIPFKNAINEIEINSGSQFDPELCKSFIEIVKKGLGNYYLGEKIFIHNEKLILSNKEIRM